MNIGRNLTNEVSVNSGGPGGHSYRTGLSIFNFWKKSGNTLFLSKGAFQKKSKLNVKTFEFGSDRLGGHPSELEQGSRVLYKKSGVKMKAWERFRNICQNVAEHLCNDNVVS